MADLSFAVAVDLADAVASEDELAQHSEQPKNVGLDEPPHELVGWRLEMKMH